MQLEDVGLGNIQFLKLGYCMEFEFLSTYGGHSIGTLQCENIKQFICETDQSRDDELFGSYIACVKVNKIKNVCDQYAELGASQAQEGFLITMESGAIWIKVVCVEIKSDLPFQEGTI